MPKEVSGSRGRTIEMLDEPYEANRMLLREDGRWEVVCGDWERNHFYPHFARVHEDPMVVLNAVAQDVRDGKTKSVGILVPIEAIEAIQTFERAGGERIEVDAYRAGLRANDEESIQGG
jgi:hypothetical protein